MGYSDEQLRWIYDRTDGVCHICKRRRHRFEDYGRGGTWEVDHSKARTRGGAEHLNNYRLACVGCNRRKGTKSSRAARAEYGGARAPMSRRQKAPIRTRNAVLGGLVGGVVGVFVSPLGSLIGAVVGAGVGLCVEPDRSISDD